MRLVDLQDRTDGERRRISMELVWEDRRAAPQTVYFEACGSTGALLDANADAFAIACLPLAAWMGERRLQVEGCLCTRLRSGLRAVNEVFCRWHRRCRMVELEPTGGFAPTRPPEHRRVAALLSGGVDALCALHLNRVDYPLDHPESVRACITLFGLNRFDVRDDGPAPERLAAFDALLDRLGGLARSERFDLLPVYTNVRTLAPSYQYWIYVGFGAAHTSAAQLFRGHFDKVLFASDGEGPAPAPAAAHPLLDRHFSTDAVRIQTEQDEMMRREKIRLLVDWEPARRLMQPCHYVRIPQDGRINCGRCEKCVRTMLMLIGLGRLQEVSAFADSDLSVRRVLGVPVHTPHKARLLLQAVPDLRRIGRWDLVGATHARAALFYLIRK